MTASPLGGAPESVKVPRRAILKESFEVDPQVSPTQRETRPPDLLYPDTQATRDWAAGFIERNRDLLELMAHL